MRTINRLRRETQTLPLPAAITKANSPKWMFGKSLTVCPDGTAYQYSVNTAHGQTTILNNGVDAPNALDGYVSLYSKDDHLAGGWAPREDGGGTAHSRTGRVEADQ